MTEAERLEELLKAWDVPHEVRSAANDIRMEIEDDDNGVNVLVFEGGDSVMQYGAEGQSGYKPPERKWNGTPAKATGYGLFFTRFEFDAAGTFRRMGAWE